MLIKNRQVPLRMKMDEALLRRLPANHYKRKIIEEDFAKRKAGYDGEQAIDYFINRLPSHIFHIFHDLRLNVNSHYFQIDTLLLSQYFTIIIEIKNIVGTLYFDTISKQFIRKLEDREEGFRDPIIQVKEQKELLNEWFEVRGLSSFPIETLIGISNPSTIVTASKNSHHIYKKVLHFEHLKDRIFELMDQHKRSRITNRELLEIGNSLQHEHAPLVQDVTKIYGIESTEVGKGVYCNVCTQLSMVRGHGRWKCLKCGKTCRTGHIQAIQDYLLLVDRFITNKDCRSFLKLKDPAAASRILKSTGLPWKGGYKDRRYFLPEMLK
ncbi:nuclease-related domain-containing protein [Radiobacillus deserti]|uniref:NERD domain-containing protein n=1 Tax=Radiobacillus deserti TaxID=2594883 RepID=A0A516KEQ3_9BACI|nr:nuclease-related domain-containing protein [Radiobacillus deserti]QDP39892.1 NERD domain-containing protein [Radiobacillus deserti]